MRSLVGPSALAALVALVGGCAEPTWEITLTAVPPEDLAAVFGVVPPGYGHEAFAFSLAAQIHRGDEVAPLRVASVGWRRGRAPAGATAFRLRDAKPNEALAFWGEGPPPPTLPVGPAVLGTAPRLDSVVEGLFDVAGRVVASTVVAALSPALTLGGALQGQPTMAGDLLAEINKVDDQPVGDGTTALLLPDARRAEYERRLRFWNDRATPWREALRRTLDAKQGHDLLFVRKRADATVAVEVILVDDVRGEQHRTFVRLEPGAPRALTLARSGRGSWTTTAEGTFPAAESLPDEAELASTEALGPPTDEGRLGDAAARTLAAWREDELSAFSLEPGAGQRAWKARTRGDPPIDDEPLFCRIRSRVGGGLAQWVHGYTRRFAARFGVSGGESTVALPRMTLARGEKIRFSLGRRGWFSSEVLGDVLVDHTGMNPLTLAGPSFTVTCFTVDEASRRRELPRVGADLARHVRDIRATKPTLTSVSRTKVKETVRAATTRIEEARWVWGATPEELAGWHKDLHDANEDFVARTGRLFTREAARAPRIADVKEHRVRFAFCPPGPPEEASWKIVMAGPRTAKDSAPYLWSGVWLFFADGSETSVPSAALDCPHDPPSTERQVACATGDVPVLAAHQGRTLRPFAPSPSDGWPDLCAAPGPPPSAPEPP